MFVCAQLDNPGEGQVAQCVLWVEEQPLLPPLTLEQGGYVSAACLLVLACAWGFRALADHLKL